MVADISYLSSDGSRLDTSGAVGEDEEKEIVRVLWMDIIAHSDWTTHDKVTCPVFESIGWLVHKDDREIKIATTLDRHDGLGENDGEPTYYGITSFPSGCVLSCVPLRSFVN